MDVIFSRVNVFTESLHRKVGTRHLIIKNSLLRTRVVESEDKQMRSYSSILKVISSSASFLEPGPVIRFQVRINLKIINTTESW
jgi:hypothetical protein